MSDPATHQPGSPPAAQALMQAFFNSLGSEQQAELARAGSAVSAETAKKLADLQQRFSREHLALWTSLFDGRQGVGQPVAQAAPGDRRFAAPQWRANPFHDYLRQSYLLNSRYVLESIELMEVDERTRERLRFAARQMVDAFSPANFAATNPEALQLALDSQGATLMEGMRNFMEDARKGRITTTDESVFEVGRNIAATPGAVVYRNELIELLQYAPMGEQVYSRPLLMVPPCINKYYILDLQPENSLVRYAVEQGHTVFMVSWRNATAAQERLGWNDYLDQGVVQAIAAVKEITGAKDINALGFCVGGTLLASALAVLEARDEKSGGSGVHSLTLLAAMLDFSDTGEIGLFVDEAGVAAREAAIGSGGIMPGRELALVFASLRANDLVWPYVVNNYLKGRKPEAFDLLYWNADSTNLPGPMYCWYLRHMYLLNALKDPGRLHMLGEAVDLGRLTMPAYIMGSREDHIVPWRTAYLSTGLLKGPQRPRFVLGASGHIAGVINPAAKNRRSYWTGEGLAADENTADAWLAAAKEQAGSWWKDWSAWLATQGGGKVKAKKRLGGRGRKPLEPAPGSYVKQRVT